MRPLHPFTYEIREKHAGGGFSTRRLAEAYGLSKSRVHEIVSGRDYHSYTHVEVKNTIRHGHYLKPGYHTWVNMLRRCEDPRHDAYRYYGALGVSVCERWHSLANFIADMGPRPSGLTLDRIDPFGDYEPSNCRWATPSEQRRNQRPRKARKP